MAIAPLYPNQQTTVGYDQSASDYGHILVNCFLDDGRKATIGHIYVEVNGDEIKYISLNAKGREIFTPSTDFNAVEKQFERYAHLYKIKQKIKEKFKRPSKYKFYSSFKKSNPMKNQSNQTQQKQKENQLRFLEYEKATGDGHFITVMDSYRNVIGRMYKSYNDETKKYEYLAFDHAGNLMGKNDKLWQLKNEFVNNREQLLEQAHQRRIESKEKSKDSSKEKTNEKAQIPQTAKAQERKNETELLRQGKKIEDKQHSRTPDKSTGEKEIVKSGAKEIGSADKQQDRQQEREAELSDLRDEQEEDRGDMNVER